MEFKLLTDFPIYLLYLTVVYKILNHAWVFLLLGAFFGCC